MGPWDALGLDRAGVKQGGVFRPLHSKRSKEAKELEFRQKKVKRERERRACTCKLGGTLPSLAGWLAFTLSEAW